MSFYSPFIPGSAYVTNGVISTFNSNTIGNIFTTKGNVGINISAPVCALDVSGDSHITGIISAGTYTGSLFSAASIGVSGATVGTLYASTVTAANVQLSGTVSASNHVGTLVSVASIGATGITVGTLYNTNLNTSYITASTLNLSTGITTANINFTGTLSQNGIPYVGSQWTTTNGNLFYTGGNIGIYTSAPVYALDVSGGARITGTISASNHVGTLVSSASIGAAGVTVGTLYASTITTGTLYVSGTTISVNITTQNQVDTNITTGTLNATTGITTASLLSTGVISAASIGVSGVTVGTLYANTITTTNLLSTNVSFGNFTITNLSWGNLAVTNFTSSNLVANNVNFGISSLYGSSFNAANNVTSASNITGFVFNSSSVISFTANVTVVINATTNLYETFTLNGSYSSSGWTLNSTSRGDISGIVFSITTGGQVQYTSTSISGWTSSSIRYTVNQNSLTGNYSSLSQPTTGNTYIYDSINLTNTANAVSGSSVGSAYMAGGLTVAKNLIVNGQLSRQIGVSSFACYGTVTAANISLTNITPILANITNTSGYLSTTGNSIGVTNLLYTNGNIINNSNTQQTYLLTYSLSLPYTIGFYQIYFSSPTTNRILAPSSMYVSNTSNNNIISGCGTLILNTNENIQMICSQSTGSTVSFYGQGIFTFTLL